MYEAVYSMMAYSRKGWKRNRTRQTRAEFVAGIARSAGAKIEFYSRQLDVKQPAAKPDTKPTSSSKVTTSGGATKSPVIGANSNGLTVRGAAMSQSQADLANQLLKVCRAHSAPEHVAVAMIYAAIWESSISNQPAKKYGYWGVLACNRYNLGQYDVQGMATHFLTGGKGYGSALKIGQSTRNPGQIAVRTEAPSIWPDNAYAKESGTLVRRIPNEFHSGPCSSRFSCWRSRALFSTGSTMIVRSSFGQTYVLGGNHLEPAPTQLPAAPHTIVPTEGRPVGVRDRRQPPSQLERATLRAVSTSILGN